MVEADEAERTAIERVLAFANLERVLDAEQVYVLFADPAEAPRLAFLRGDGSATPLWFQRLHTPAAPGDAAILRSNLAWLEEMLSAFAAAPQKARTAYADRIAGLVAKGVLAGTPTFQRQRLLQPLHFMSSGLEASCGYALALLFDRSRPYGKSLRRCALDTCEKWFLSVARGQGGPRPKFHTPECQLAADKVSAVGRSRMARARARKGK